MALSIFNAPVLPNPPPDYDAQYFRQLLGVIELYFRQLDSNTPNSAESYTADFFYGGLMRPANLTTAEKNALTPELGTVIFDTTLGKLCVYTSGGWQTVTSV